MSYGTATPSTLAHATGTSDQDSDAPPILNKQGHASLSSSVVNLTNTIIGAGALAFPSAFASMGLVLGAFSCVFSCFTTAFGLFLLSRCATLVGQRPGDEGKKASFNEVARLAFKQGGAVRVFDLAIAIKCFGVSVSYLVICKTLLPQVSETLAVAIHHPLATDSLLLSSDFWLLLVMLLVIPLSFLRTLDALRFTSQIALGTVVYLVIVVTGWYVFKGESPNRGKIVLGRFGPSTLASFPVQVFAYTCAQNLFPIYNELHNKTQQRMNTVIGVSLGSAAFSYEILGIIGYLTFGSKVGSNIIAMYPATSLVIALGRVGIVLLVGLSYPLQLLPCRNSVHALTKGLVKWVQGRTDEPDESGFVTPAGVTPNRGSDERQPLASGFSGVVKRGGDMTQKKFIVLTVGILVAGFFLALTVDKLEVVLGFVGSTGSTIISFILPGFFYFRMFRAEPGPTKWFALALGIYGIAVMAFCLTFNIINLYK